MILQSGDKVRYCRKYFPYEQNGIVKSIGETEGHVFVVFNCDGDWDNYFNYTAASTRITDLKLGWLNSEQEAQESVARDGDSSKKPTK